MRLAQGFTLLELLVVLVIAGITLGLVSYNAMPSDQQALRGDAQRIALLLQLGRDEAIVRNRAIAFEAEADRYRFLLREDNAWQVLSQDNLLREREFKRSPIAFFVNPPQVGATGAAAATANPDVLRIVFGREPVDKPFVLTLSHGAESVAIRADGIGHFVVE
jgi:general secretion pathway protein H